MTEVPAESATPPRFSPGRAVAAVPPGVLLAFAWMAACILAIILFPLISDLSVSAIDLRARLAPPVGLGGTWAHPLGTDDLGRDVLARLISSIRTSLLLALGAVAISATIGTLIGIAAAHIGGWFDQIVVAAVDAQVSVPFIIISLTLTAVFGNSLTLFIIVLGLFGWERYTRLARAMTLAARGRGYVLPEDLGDLAPDCLRHRLVLSYEALAEGLTADALIARVMARLPLPDKPMQHQST